MEMYAVAGVAEGGERAHVGMHCADENGMLDAMAEAVVVVATVTLQMTIDRACAALHMCGSGDGDEQDPL